MYVITRNIEHIITISKVYLFYDKVSCTQFCNLVYTKCFLYIIEKRREEYMNLGFKKQMNICPI